jgi:hypothetical protein
MTPVIAQAVVGKPGPGKVYIIMARRSWEKLQRQKKGVKSAVDF